MASRHGVVHRGWGTRPVRGSYGCGLWKGIMMGWDQFQNHLRFTVGMGDRVRLWHDRWCGDMALKDTFPTLFECASHQDAFLNEVMVRQNGRVVWNVSFTCNFNDWEMDYVLVFLTLIESKAPLREVEDGSWWHLRQNDGLTFVHSMTIFRILLLLFFLGRVFGAPKLLVGFVSLFEWQLGIRFLLMTIFPSGVTPW